MLFLASLCGVVAAYICFVAVFAVYMWIDYYRTVEPITLWKWIKMMSDTKLPYE